EAFVREEVRVRKEVEQEVVNTSETVRREELDVNTGNLPVDERTDRI
ncbi:MAG TPA: photosystem reaction center subunit H, partial [Cyanobacteria bacterium UBA11049]|nr:photosystem reaction center subunit H [Cyanobacteria bacterium UBA11049]